MASSSSPKHSVVIAVGDELLRGHTLDSNTNWLAQRLYTLGFPVRRVHIVSDVQDEIVAAVRGEMTLEPTCLFLCGGLGPTPDDRTLAALAVALERPLGLDAQAAAHIQVRLDWLHGIGRIKSPEMHEANRRMAEVPEGATILDNARGGPFQPRRGGGVLGPAQPDRARVSGRVGGLLPAARPRPPDHPAGRRTARRRPRRRRGGPLRGSRGTRRGDRRVVPVGAAAAGHKLRDSTRVVQAPESRFLTAAPMTTGTASGEFIRHRAHARCPRSDRASRSRERAGITLC